MDIPLEDGRPLPHFPKPSWFENEIYIEFRDADKKEKFSHLLTMTKSNMKPLQLIRNGALDEEGQPAEDGGFITVGCGGLPEGLTERVKRFKRLSDNDGEVSNDATKGLGSWLNLGGEYFSVWEVALGYAPRDLETGENGEEPKQGARLEQAIWSLKRVGTNYREADYGLFYILKTVGKDSWGVSLEAEDLTDQEEIPADGRELSLHVDDKEWIAFAPHMVTHRIDEFIFEVRGKHRIDEEYSTTEWRDAYEGRTLNFGKGAIEPGTGSSIADLCYRFSGPCHALGTEFDEGDSGTWETGKLGERGSEGDLVLTNERWRAPVASGGGADHDEEEAVNHISPSIRGHQVWRLSIPADKETDPEEPYEPPEYVLFNFFMDWQNRAGLQVCLIIGALFGSAIWAGFAGGWPAFWASLGGAVLGCLIMGIVAVSAVYLWVKLAPTGRPLEEGERSRP